MQEFWVKAIAEVPGLALMAFLVWRWSVQHERLTTSLMNHQSEEFKAAIDAIGNKLDSLGDNVTRSLFALIDKLTNKEG